LDHGPPPQGGLDCCDSCQQADCCCHRGCLAAGFAFVLVQPHFENDVAFITSSATTATTGNGRLINNDATAFDYDLELSPRVWLEYCKSNQLGFRATYWQFDHAAPGREATRGETAEDDIIVIRAPIDDIVIAADQAGDVFRAGTTLDMDVIDLEGTKWTDFCSWQFGATAGLRYASIRQTYFARVTDNEGDPLDAFGASHRFDGVGPTFSLEIRRPMGCLTWFSMARGSLLYGDGEAGFTALDQITPTTVTTTTASRSERNDVITAAEVQFGLEWCRQYCGGKRMFCRTAMEGQVWQGAGNAISEDGDLGLFGFHIALGMTL
jgi:hypothetical protein